MTPAPVSVSCAAASGKKWRNWKASATTREPPRIPCLGRELQQLRDALRASLMDVDERLRREVGVSLGPPASRGCRMSHAGIPPADEEE